MGFLHRINGFKIASASFFLLLAHGASGGDYRFSEQSCDGDKGVVVFTRKVDGQSHLFLNNLNTSSTKHIQLDQKSSTPVLCGNNVAVCFYGANKITLYDYDLKQVAEINTEKLGTPFCCTCGSNGKFLYVYMVKLGGDNNAESKFVYKYAHADGRLEYVSSALVGVVGKLVEFNDSIFVVSATNCERVNFESK